MKKQLITAIGIALVTSFATSQAQAEQYLVVAGNNDFSQTQIQAVQQAGGQVIKVFSQIGVAVATSLDSAFPTTVQGITGVQSIVPDPVAVMVCDTELPPAEPASTKKPSIEKGADLTSLQWGLQAIQAPAAWALGFPGKGVRVAVLDGGIMTTHPDLAPNLNLALSTSVVPGETVEFIPGAGSDNRSHATHVAGIIAAADNGFGTTGVAPDAELVAIKIGSDQAYETRMSWVVEGILYAAQIHAAVANMSFGVASWIKNEPPEGLPEVDVAYSVAKRAALWAEQQGTLLVAAAGNGAIYWHGDGNRVDLPRDLPGVLAVAATAPLECWAFDHTVDLDWPAPYTDARNHVVSAFNGGRFLILQRDHGSWNGWGSWQFTNVVNLLTNGPLLPVIFTLSCSTGFFDNETNPGETRPLDPEKPYPSLALPPLGTGPDTLGRTYFAEQLIRHPLGGAIALIGATRDSSSWPNDFLTLGLVDAIWPDAVADFGGDTPIRRLGDVLNHAKAYLFTQEGTDEGWEDYWHDEPYLFNLIGDPTLAIWTSQPVFLATDHSVLFFERMLKLRYPIEGATLTAFQSSEDGMVPIGRAEVKDGEATLEYVVAPREGLPILFSASKENAVSRLLISHGGGDAP